MKTINPKKMTATQENGITFVLAQGVHLFPLDGINAGEVVFYGGSEWEITRASINRKTGDLTIDVRMKAAVAEYEPPFGGKVQPREELDKVHERWLEKNCTPYGPPKRTDEVGKQWDDGALLQCGGCMYYVPLEGSLGMDWGACSNPRSPQDGKVTFEHHGCMAYNNWDLPKPASAEPVAEAQAEPPPS